MEPATLADVFAQGIERFPRPDRFLQKANGAWRPVSTEEFARQARACAGSIASLGITRGDGVAILSYNRVEWAIVDYACHLLGAVVVPLYSTLPADACAYILEDSGAKAIFVEDAVQEAKVAGRLPHVIRMDTLADFLKKGDGALPPSPAQPDDLATLIYTSGTTGVPKGVMLTHRNLVSNMLASCAALTLEPSDLALSFLPLSHSFERLLDYALFHCGAPIAYAESVDKVADNMIEVRPTVMAAVPRFYEKIYARVLDSAQKMKPSKRKVFDWARGVGALEAAFRQRGRRPPFSIRWRFALARRLVFGKLAERLGGRMRLFISGGAPLSREVGDFFFSIGLTVLEGYGLTETSPVLTLNRPGAMKPGTVGQAISGVELQIAPDGEILARGPNIMKGYFNKPADTAEVLKEGWFATGDIGEIDAEGYLRITDRKKDLLKTAGGKYIAPQPIEGRLKADPRVLNAVVIGDRRPFPAALLVPAPGATRADLQAALDAVNQGLAPYEKIKKFAILEGDFTIESGELTPTLKVRRRAVEKKHHDRIEALYAEGPDKS